MAERVKTFGKGIYVSPDSVVEEGATIYAPAQILKGTHICRGATVMPFCCLSAAYVGENTTVFSSTLTDSQVGKNCTVGPYAYLRAGTKTGDFCRIGDFAEIKNSVLGNGCRAAHLCYIGDAVLGENVNVGCGVVFANFDGKEKKRTYVGDNVFIGCNSNLVAPLKIGSGAYIAAGTTLTRDLEAGDFCIARPRETVKKGGAAGRYKDG